MAAATKRDFFISFNKADRGWAEWIAWELEAVGYLTIFQPWDFRPGSNFVLEMQAAARVADRTVAVLSPDYLGSLFTQAEWAAAFAADPTGNMGKLIPIRVRDCKVEGIQTPIIFVDLVGLNEDLARKALRAGVQRGRAKPKDPPSFPGPRPHSGPAPSFPGSARASLPATARAGRHEAWLVALVVLTVVSALVYRTFGPSWPTALSAVRLQAQVLRGQILDDQSGIPLAGVLVTLPELNLEQTTDQQGRYRFDVAVPAGRQLKLRAFRKGYQPLNVDPPAGTDFLNTHHMRRVS